MAHNAARALRKYYPLELDGGDLDVGRFGMQGATEDAGVVGRVTRAPSDPSTDGGGFWVDLSSLGELT